MSLEERLATVEHDTKQIIDVLEQIAKDAELESVNILRAIRRLPQQSPAKAETHPWTWNPLQIQWAPKEGAKGPYETSEDLNNTDFKQMHKDLTEHKGALNRDNCFYWLFQNGTTVGRKVVK